MLSGKEIAKRVLVTTVWHTMGRRNLVRLSRFLLDEARLDVPNDIRTNGELLVQEVVIDWARRDSPLVVFDVGANVGEWSKQLLDRCERRGGIELDLHLFEPCRSTFSLLKEAVNGSPTVRVYAWQLAVSNTTGEANLNVFADDAGTNSLQTRAECQASRIERVELLTIDAYCQRENVRSIALLKIDAEGHDLAVLEGSRGMLAAQRIGLLQFEYNRVWINSRRYLRDAFELLLPLNYKLGKITPRGIEFYPRWHPELESYREANYVACVEAWAARFPQIGWWNSRR